MYICIYIYICICAHTQTYPPRVLHNLPPYTHTHIRSRNTPQRTLQHTATHYNTLHHTATHCNIPLHTATHQIPQRQTDFEVMNPTNIPMISPSGGFGPVSDEGYGVA